MFEDNEDNEGFDEFVQSIVREVGRSIERLVENFDSDQAADAIGLDSSAAREWVASAANWLRTRTENVGDEVGFRAAGAGRSIAADDPLESAAPHPLDLPTDEQGLALAALHSGRWAVEPGTEALTVKRDGPGPSNALGIVRELRVRDWIAADGEITLVGRRALGRWLENVPTRS